MLDYFLVYCHLCSVQKIPCCCRFNRHHQSNGLSSGSSAFCTPLLQFQVLFYSAAALAWRFFIRAPHGLLLWLVYTGGLPVLVYCHIPLFIGTLGFLLALLRASFRCLQQAYPVLQDGNPCSGRSYDSIVHWESSRSRLEMRSSAHGDITPLIQFVWRCEAPLWLAFYIVNLFLVVLL